MHLTPGNLRAILFDRDGTLIVDVPYSGEPSLVTAMPTAHTALARARALGIATGVVSNQSGIARGLITHDQVRRVNARVDRLLGGFDVWRYCPHGPADGCDCRKPRPGMIVSAAQALGVPPACTAVIGDIGADVAAARAAGARAVLVPTAVTRADEIAAAPAVADTLDAAVQLLLAQGEAS